MAKEYSYRNLVLWQRSQTLALSVIAIVRKLPSDWGNAVIARQVIASSTSVSANIAEGHARYTIGAHRNHLSIARGSIAETDSWIDLLRRLGVLSPEEEQLLHEECVWIMDSLKSKILDLERMGASGNRIDEPREDYQLTIMQQETEPVWPFLESDYIV